MEVDNVGIIAILSMSYITTRIVKTYTSVAKISRVPVEIVYFDTRGQNVRLAHCIFTRAVSESLVWPHVSNHIFLYKCAVTQLHSTAVNTAILT